MDKHKVHEEFVHQFKFYLFNVGHDFNKASFRAIDETFQVMWENNYYEKMAQMEEAHNQPPPDKCLFIDSDEEDEINFLKKRLEKEQVKNTKLGIENDLLKEKVYELEKYKEKQEYKYQPVNDILGQFMELCEWKDNIEYRGDSFAPIEFEDIFYHFKRWCMLSAYKVPDKQKTKDDMIKIQKKSKYGFQIGKRMTEKCPNGTYKKPRFNFEYLDDDE